MRFLTSDFSIFFHSQLKLEEDNENIKQHSDGKKTIVSFDSWKSASFFQLFSKEQILYLVSQFQRKKEKVCTFEKH